MRNKRFFFIVLIIMFLVSLNLFAQSNQPLFGYVNIAEVMLLHPTMKYFDTKEKKFKLEAIMKDDDDVEKRVEENKIKQRVSLYDLEDEIKKLKNKRIELEESYYSRIESLAIQEKNINQMSESQRKSYEEFKATLDTKFFNEADKLRTSLYEKEQKLEQMKNNPIGTGLTNIQETNQLFSLMLDDIYEAINQVTEENKLSFVFNSSAEISFLEGRITTPNQLSYFFDEYQKDLDNPDTKKIVGAGIYAWLDEKNTVFLNCNDHRLNTFVISGGVNLTPFVIDKIYEKYKIGKEQRDFIKEYFEKIANKEFPF